MPSRYLKLAILAALLAVVLAGAAPGSACPARGKLVVHVRVDGVLTPEGTLGSAPGAGAHITVTGHGKSLHLRADHHGIAKRMLRPGRYKVSIRLSAPESSEPGTAVVRARKTTTVRLAIVCNTC